MRSFYVLVLSLLEICSGQTLIDGFMPGSSPDLPNLALNMCKQQAIPKHIDVTPAGKHGSAIYSWCTVHEHVIPCLGRMLPSASSPSDWYLRLIYNETIATRMSTSICERFPHISNLMCVEEDMSKVQKCMQWTTKSAIDHFFDQFIPGVPLTDERRKMASIYACIISVATAGCFYKELKTCTQTQQKLMHDFNILLGGKCREIAGIPDITTTMIITTEMETSRRANDQMSSVSKITTSNPIELSAQTKNRAQNGASQTKSGFYVLFAIIMSIMFETHTHFE